MDLYIASGGFFTRFLQLPLRGWHGKTFGEANGVRSLVEMRDRIAEYRRSPIGPADNPTIGCIMLAEPFLETGPGKALWEAVCERLKQSPAPLLEKGTATDAAIESGGFGRPQIIHPRLGQGLFRILVTDAYSRRCAITGERTLPVLEAAHIKPYPLVKRHEVSNGLLLRADLHKLFDEGYLTVDPQDRRIAVSKRIKEESENGRDYYKLEGVPLREPAEPWARPSAENLEYHAYSVFR
jgi:putative restriction endonuclease